MSLKLELETSETASLGTQYEQVVKDTTKMLWRHKWLIMAFLIVLPALAFLALVLRGPRYTAEAMIEFSFNRMGAALDSRTQQPIATVDASMLVDSAARLLRSRSIAGVVVTRLRLDNDSRYTGTSPLLQALAFARATLRLPQAQATSHDRAVNEVLRRVSITAQPRSYVISIAATAEQPERATLLVNAVAWAYLQSRMQQEVSVAANEMKQASAIYGTRHPNYQAAQTKLQQLEAQLTSLGEDSRDGTSVVGGESVILGEVVAGPSSAQIVIVLGIALAVGLACGIWTTLHEATLKIRLEAILRKIWMSNRTQAGTLSMTMRRVRPFATVKTPRRK